MTIATEDLSRSVEETVSVILKVRKRFEQGITSIIAVPPFVSRCIVHDHDGLQRACAALLEDTLSKQEGVAVVELSEAQTLRHEIDLLPERIEERVVPLIVNGEFKVSANADVDVSSLSIAIQDDSGIVDQETYSVPISEIGALLRNTIAPKVMKIVEADETTIITADRQFELLTKRAALLATVSAHEEATGVHEAALLLRPYDIGQRLMAINGNYALLYSIYKAEISRRKSDLKGQGGQQSIQDSQNDHDAKRKVACLTSMGNHLEYLMANRLVNVREAKTAFTKILWSNPACNDDEGQRERDRFFWRLIPRFEKLDPTIRGGNTYRMPNDTGRNSNDFWSASKQHVGWHIAGLSYVLLHPSYRLPDADTNERVLRFFDLAIQSPVPSRTIVSLLLNSRTEAGGVPSSVSLGRLKKPDMQKLFEAMSSRQHVVHQFYGRCGKIGLRLLDPITEEDASALQREISQLIMLVRQSDARGSGRAHRAGQNHRTPREHPGESLQ